MPVQNRARTGVPGGAAPLGWWMRRMLEGTAGMTIERLDASDFTQKVEKFMGCLQNQVTLKALANVSPGPGLEFANAFSVIDFRSVFSKVSIIPTFCANADASRSQPPSHELWRVD